MSRECESRVGNVLGVIVVLLIWVAGLTLSFNLPDKPTIVFAVLAGTVILVFTVYRQTGDHDTAFFVGLAVGMASLSGIFSAFVVEQGSTAPGTDVPALFAFLLGVIAVLFGALSLKEVPPIDYLAMRIARRC